MLHKPPQQLLALCRQRFYVFCLFSVLVSGIFYLLVVALALAQGQVTLPRGVLSPCKVVPLLTGMDSVGCVKLPFVLLSAASAA